MNTLSGRRAKAAPTDTSDVRNWRWPRRTASLTLAWLVAIVVLAVSLLPIVNIVHIIATTGDNNLSNDYMIYMPYVDHLLIGDYDWRNYFRDTFHTSHSLAIPFVIRSAVVFLTSWNVYYELYAAVILCALRVLFLGHALISSAGRHAWWIVWPTLAALVFSSSQINLFTYGDAALTIGLIQLGLAIAIWSIVRYPNMTRGLLGAVFGGIVASLSGGQGVPVWPTVLFGCVAMGFRRPWHFGMLLLAAAATGIPYLQFTSRTDQPPAALSNFLRYLLSCIGWPFMNGIGTTITPGWPAIWRGALGMSLLALVCGLGLFLGRLGYRRYVVGAMLVAYSLLTIALIGIGRSQQIAPWYASTGMTFWIGLLSLAYAASGAASGASAHAAWHFASMLRRPWVANATLGVVFKYRYRKLEQRTRGH